MKLSFYGAAHEVTGSCYLLELCGKNVLIDCGMEQGRDLYENQELHVSPVQIDYVLLTHAHIDHSGNLPLLYSRGFRGTVCTTTATAKLCDIMLRDSAHIQSFEAEWRNRKAKRAGSEPYVPLYTMEDALGVLKLFRPYAYETEIALFPGLTVRFVDAGHLLGSASLELRLEEDGEARTLVFSGDIGNTDQPILKNPTYLTNADYIVMESTYGGRTHGPRTDFEAELTDVIQKALDRGGNVVIPSFAVGRTQELLYFIRKIKADQRIHGHDNFPVIVDSPLANEATKIFSLSVADCFDDEARALVEQGINPLTFPGLQTSVTSEDSKLINANPEPKVILSASGMCEAGRIRHHLKHNLWRPECTVLFVGYQALGTLGRSLVEGAKTVRLFGETVEVQANIRELNGISGHADEPGLLKWAGSFHKPRHVFVTHGDDEVCDRFAEKLHERFGFEATAPYMAERWDLIRGVCVVEGSRKKIEKSAKSAKVSTVFGRLQAAGARLVALITRNEGGANKELAKFADQINALCDKWER